MDDVKLLFYASKTKTRVVSVEVVRKREEILLEQQLVINLRHYCIACRNASKTILVGLVVPSVIITYLVAFILPPWYL